MRKKEPLGGARTARPGRGGRGSGGFAEQEERRFQPAAAASLDIAALLSPRHSGAVAAAYTKEGIIRAAEESIIAAVAHNRQAYEQHPSSSPLSSLHQPHTFTVSSTRRRFSNNSRPPITHPSLNKAASNPKTPPLIPQFTTPPVYQHQPGALSERGTASSGVLASSSRDGVPTIRPTRRLSDDSDHAQSAHADPFSHTPQPNLVYQHSGVVTDRRSRLLSSPSDTDKQVPALASASPTPPASFALLASSPIPADDVDTDPYALDTDISLDGFDTTPQTLPCPAHFATGVGPVAVWRECTVVDYDESMGRYRVRWVDIERGGREHEVKVPRARLRFEHEDPEEFARRVEAALAVCEHEQQREAMEKTLDEAIGQALLESHRVSAPVKLSRSTLLGVLRRVGGTIDFASSSSTTVPVSGDDDVGEAEWRSIMASQPQQRVPFSRTGDERTLQLLRWPAVRAFLQAEALEFELVNQRIVLYGPTKPQPGSNHSADANTAASVVARASRSLARAPACLCEMALLAADAAVAGVAAQTRALAFLEDKPPGGTFQCTLQLQVDSFQDRCRQYSTTHLDHVMAAVDAVLASDKDRWQSPDGQATLKRYLHKCNLVLSSALATALQTSLARYAASFTGEDGALFHVQVALVDREIAIDPPTEEAPDLWGRLLDDVVEHVQQLPVLKWGAGMELAKVPSKKQSMAIALAAQAVPAVRTSVREQVTAFTRTLHQAIDQWATLRAVAFTAQYATPGRFCYWRRGSSKFAGAAAYTFGASWRNASKNPLINPQQRSHRGSHATGAVAVPAQLLHGHARSSIVDADAQELNESEMQHRIDKPLQDFTTALSVLQAEYDKLLEELRRMDGARVGVYRVECKSLITLVQEAAEQQRDCALRSLQVHTRDMCTALRAHLHANQALLRLPLPAVTPEQFVAMEALIHNHEAERADIQQSINELAEQLALLEECRIPLSDSEVDVFWRVVRAHARGDMSVSETAERAAAARPLVARGVRAAHAALVDDVAVLVRRAVTWESAEDTQTGRVAEVWQEVAEGLEAMHAARRELDNMEVQAEGLGFELGEECAQLLDPALDAARPLALLWETAFEWCQAMQQWCSVPFRQLNATAMQSELTALSRKVTQLTRMQKDKSPGLRSPSSQKVLWEVKQRVDAMSASMTAIARLRHPGMRRRHWDMLARDLGPSALAAADDSATLPAILAMPLAAKHDVVAAVVGRAMQEHSLEQSLETMEREFRSATLAVVTVAGEATNTNHNSAAREEEERPAASGLEPPTSMGAGEAGEGDNVVAEQQGRQSSQRMVLTGVEEAERLLEEQAVTLKALLNSPFVGPYERAVRNWQDKVAHVRDVVGQLAACQRQWTFFQSVFRSLHVRGQLKEEARKYEAMEATWGWLAALVGRVRGLAAVCESPMLANHLRECRSVTEGLMHRLTAYLEEKRAAFPRFFLLSNAQLLDVMSREHDPASLLVSSNATTTHVLSPCFRALKAIHLTPDVHVRALQGEEPNCELVLRRHIPCEGQPIEKWLANTLTEARASLLTAVRNRLEALPENSDELGPDVDATADVHKATTTDVFRAATSLLGESDKAERGEHIRQHKQPNSIQAAANFMLLASAWRTELSQPFPTQVFALASRIAFARQVERAVLSSSNGHSGMGGVYVGGSTHVLLAAEHAQRVHHLAVLCAILRGGHFDTHRNVLKTLVMHGMYERDVLGRLLSTESIASVEDFEWQRCLRYYWQNNKCYVEMGSVRLEYGCEYEGESSGSSLVLTPETERCHLALLSATRSTMAGGGAVGLRGPGGCGKTETVREASRAAGKLCVVMSCGNKGGDPDAVMRELVACLKGVAASGAWGVLDNLHALTPGVMSVLATVISGIHRAVKVASSTVAIEGATLRLDTTCAVCFTCAGTMKDSAVPDNLRSVLRPTTVLEPDVGHAAAVLLAAEGFQHAPALANKLALCYRLAREQLPCREGVHSYDFGMRAVKLVVRTMAAMLLAQTTDARQSCTEEALLLTAIQRCNESRLAPPDAHAFASITAEVFPGLFSTHPPTSPSAALLTALETRRAAILLGGIAAGKTTSWKTSAATSSTDVEVVYPAALTDGTLYGEVARGGHVWSDGVVPAALRRAATGGNAGGTARHWLVFDAPSLAPHWAEGLSPLLGDVGEDVVGGHACGGALTLANGDRVTAPPRGFSIIFEVATLEGVSPGLVSRCGVVHVDGTSVTWLKVYEAWLEGLPGDIAPNKELLRRLGEEYVPDVWAVIKDACPDVVEVAVAQTLVKYMQAFFQAAGVWKVRQRDESQQQQEEAGGKSAVEGTRHLSKWRDINKGWRRHVVGISSQVALYKLNDEAYLSPPTSPGGRGGNEEDDLHSPRADKFVDAYWASHAFLFALVWAYGGPLHASQRQRFDHVLRTRMARDEHNPAWEARFPAEGTVFDYVYDNVTQRWRRCMDKGRLYHSMDTSSSEVDADGLNIVVPESLPVAVMTERLLAAHVGVLVVGEPAVGKTSLLMRLLHKKRAEHTHVTVAFKLNCASTPAGITETVSSKLQRHKSGAMEPPPPQQLVVFIDDVSSAPLDTHGSAPTLELLRQVLERCGWHARASTSVSSSTPTFTPVSRTTFLISARHVPAHHARAVRHVARLRLCSLASSSLRGVFTALLRTRTRELRSAGGIGGVGEQSIADAAVQVYETVKKEFAAGMERVGVGGIGGFDARDLFQVVRGLCHADLEHIKEPHEVVSLWAHECQHAFGDRLGDPSDYAKFSQILLSTAQQHFSQSNLPDIITHNTSNNDDIVLFGSYATLGHPRYIASRMSTFTREITIHMAESASHSSNSNTCSTTLTLFPDAARHLASLLRALQLPGGRALLVLGHPAAAGRRTLAALAAHVLDYVLVQVPVNVDAYGTGQWKADMRRAMRIAGGLGAGNSTTSSSSTTTSSGGRQVLLLLPSVASIPRHVLADVDHLIHTGEPPASSSSSSSSSAPGGSAAPLDTEERAAICREMAMAVAGEGDDGRGDGAQGNADVLYNRFLQRVKARLHVVVCVGTDAASAAVLREFPAFAAGAAVDMYGEWSAEALHAVAHARLADCASLEVTGDQLGAVVSACVRMHTAAATIANSNPLISNTLAIPASTTLVSSGSFLELLSLFLAGAMRHSNESAATVRRLESGVARLQDAVEAVVRMRAELRELIARLNTSTVKIDGLVHTVLKEQMQVDAARGEVKQQEAAAASDALAAEETALEAQHELDAILPLMQEATRQLAGLQKGDIAELKSLTKPPEGVLLVAEALCALFGRAPVDDPRARRSNMHATMTEAEKRESNQQALRLGYWKAARQLMSQTNFLHLLRGFDKDHADPKVMLAVQGFIESPAFKPDAVGKQSVAARSICVWIRALAAYNDAAVRGVAPKLERLRELAARRDAAKAVLAVHRHELRDIEARHEALQHRYEAAEAERAGLIDSIRDSKAKVERAGRLTDALACEEERWLDKVRTLTARQRGDLGNLLLNCAHVAYAGPLAPPARKEAGAQWSVVLKKCGIACSEDYEFAGGMRVATDVSSSITRQQCMDTHANENGLILKQCRRVPLLLDPHGQGEQWVKSVGWPHGLVVSNASSSTITQALGECMAEGRVLLVQGVGAARTDAVLHHVVRAYQRGAAGGGSKLPGEAALPVHAGFRCFLACGVDRLPAYPPEVLRNLNCVAFRPDDTLLSSLLLTMVAAKEKPKLEAERAELARLHVQYDDQLQRTEDRILRLLSADTVHDANNIPAMLEDEALELALSSSASTATELRVHKRIAEAREGAISAEQGAYVGVASRAAGLFACAEMLARRRGVQEAAQTLDGFLAAARRALREIAGPAPAEGASEDEEQLREHVAHITDALSLLLFKHVCRALFHRDKLLLATLLYTRVLETDGIPAEHALRLLGVTKTTAAATTTARSKPTSRSPTSSSTPTWPTGSAKGWQELQALERHFPEQMHGICAHIHGDPEPWKYIHDSPAPEKHPLPAPWGSAGGVGTTTNPNTIPNINLPPLPDLYRLAIVRCLRPDRTLKCIETLITSRLGEGYARPATYSLSQACADSAGSGGNRVVVCVAEAGTYPADEIRECAAGMLGKKEGGGGGGVARVHHVAMGHNQSARAEAAIMEASHSGGWVVLQNCHLEANFLRTLPALLDDRFSISSSRQPVHNSFRIWLTVSPGTLLPSTLLTHAVRVAVVPPPSARTRMLRALATCRADPELKEKDVDLVSLAWPALFQLAAGHALVAGRGRYPRVGWCGGGGEGEGNVDLWNVGDLRAARAEVLACVARAREKAGGSVAGGGEEGHSGGVAEPPRLPVKALRYVLSEVVYGGRVVSARDRRVLGLLFEEALPLTVEASASSPHGTEVSMLSAPPMLPTSGNHNNSFFPSRHFPAHYSVLSYEAACAYAERGLPAHDSAPLFGLHENTDASLSRAHAHMLQQALVSISASAPTAASCEEASLNKANECMLALPSMLLVGDLNKDASDDVHASMATVFAHEARCYNVLLDVVSRSLTHMKEALNERALNSNKLQELYNDLVRDKVPALWRCSSHPTLEISLASWLRNLDKRVMTVRKLLEHTEQTPVIHLPDMLHPQRLVSAVAQAYAHANGMPLDAVHVCAVPMGDIAHTHVHMHGLAAGCFLSGVRMQGASWDAKAMELAEPGRAMSTALGLIWLKPGRSPALLAATEATYSCPVYQTASCAPGDLLFQAELPCPASLPAKHWIRRGVTMFFGEADD